MAFYYNGKLVYDFEKDGKFYKKTKTKEGKQSVCQMVRCKCGGWASKKLVNTPTHMANKQHTKWAKQHGQKVVQGYKKKEKTQSSSSKQQSEQFDLSSLFFIDKNFCSIFDFVDIDFEDYIEGWFADSNGLYFNFNVGNQDFLDNYFLNETFSSRQQIEKNHSSLTEKGLIEILNGWGWDGAFPKSPEECLYQLIHYHIFKESCLKSFNQETKTFDQKLVNALENDWNEWEKIHQSIDDELKKSGISPSMSLNNLYKFAQQQGSLPRSKRECILTLLKKSFTTSHQFPDVELLYNILLY